MGGRLSDYLTVQELADYLTIDDADDDTGLAAAITASSRAIDAWCLRSFGADTVVTSRRFQSDDSWSAVVDDFWDLATLVVKTDSGDNGTFDQTWAITTDYVVEPFNNYVGGIGGWPYYRLSATGSRYFPMSALGSGRRPRIQVTAKWGWAAVPDAVVQATYIKAARIFRRKNAPDGGGGFDSAGGFSVPLIRVSNREDPDVTALLAPYRRLAVFA